MSRAILALLLIVFAVLWLTGCSRPSASPAVSEVAAAAPSETGWDAQVASVRQGERSEIRIAAQPVDTEQWRALAEGCDSLAVLDVETLSIPDESLSLLADLPGLRRLRIGSPVGDAGLRELSRCSSLEVVNLSLGEFTDAGLAELTALPRLELLRFHSPYVTDGGMAHIARLRALRFLHLINVPISDAGLVHLYGMDELESFYLDGGNCTDEGLSRLLDALPDLHFHLDQLHLPGDPHAHPHDSERR